MEKERLEYEFNGYTLVFEDGILELFYGSPDKGKVDDMCQLEWIASLKKGRNILNDREYYTIHYIRPNGNRKRLGGAGFNIEGFQSDKSYTSLITALKSGLNTEVEYSEPKPPKTRFALDGSLSFKIYRDDLALNNASYFKSHFYVVGAVVALAGVMLIVLGLKYYNGIAELLIGHILMALGVGIIYTPYALGFYTVRLSENKMTVIKILKKPYPYNTINSLRLQKRVFVPKHTKNAETAEYESEIYTNQKISTLPYINSTIIYRFYINNPSSTKEEFFSCKELIGEQFIEKFLERGGRIEKW